MKNTIKFGNARKRMKAVTVFISLFIIAMTFASCTEGSEYGGSTGSASSGDKLTVHFLDVGQADATLLLSDGESMLIDAGNRDDAAMISEYIRKLGIEKLNNIVFTHPHEDHIGSGEYILESFGAEHIYMPSDFSGDIGERLKRRIKELGIDTVNPIPGDNIAFGKCRVEFLGPYEDYADTNDDSLCLRVINGKNSMMFTGDAGRIPERVMVESGLQTESVLLHAGHHGSSTSNSYYFLRAVNPEYAVISCGKNNMYGHPHEETLSRFSDLGAEVFRTDEQGTVIAEDDGSTITFNCEGSKPENEHIDGYEEAKYIGNINSKKYHLPTCGGLPDARNRIYFMSIERAEAAGYDPCGRCQPDKN